jgi:hypothetical protein
MQAGRPAAWRAGAAGPARLTESEQERWNTLHSEETGRAVQELDRGIKSDFFGMACAFLMAVASAAKTVTAI